MTVILGCRQGSTNVGLVHQAHNCSIPEISLHNQTVPTNTLCRHITLTLALHRTRCHLLFKFTFGQMKIFKEMHGVCSFTNPVFCV